jgi:MFS family permease
MSAYVLGGVLGPCIGPICGGYLTPAAGWRWVFWFMAIISAPVALVTLFFARESYPYVLLKHKTARLRRETGNEALRSALDLGLAPKALFLRSISRPLRMLTSPVVFALSLYVAVVYSYLYLCFTTFPRVFGDQYGFDSRASGLATLGLAIGSILGIALCAAVIDRLSAMLARRHGGDLQPEYRLPTMALGGLLVPIGLFWYGWSAEAQTHWIVPIIGTGFIAGGMMMTYVSGHPWKFKAFR